jgi:hypothetical protein
MSTRDSLIPGNGAKSKIFAEKSSGERCRGWTKGRKPFLVGLSGFFSSPGDRLSAPKSGRRQGEKWGKIKKNKKKSQKSTLYLDISFLIT